MKLSSIEIMAKQELAKMSILMLILLLFVECFECFEYSKEYNVRVY